MIKTYKDITYTLKRSSRKTASIYIERDGNVSVLVPETLTDAEINSIIESKRKWIYTNIAEWEDLNAAKVNREYVNGESFLYLGRNYRLKLVHKQSTPLVLKNGYFYLCSDKSTSAKANNAFKAFYKEKGKDKIAERIHFYKGRLGVNPNSFSIIELKNRWASCSHKGNLNFHWKVMMTPMKILDYIVVHELAHLLHPNHTVAFWNEIDKLLPDYQERKQWLRVNGAGMDI
jgi:hypothetical protein